MTHSKRRICSVKTAAASGPTKSEKQNTHNVHTNLCRDTEFYSSIPNTFALELTSIKPIRARKAAAVRSETKLSVQDVESLSVHWARCCVTQTGQNKTFMMTRDKTTETLLKIRPRCRERSRCVVCVKCIGGYKEYLVQNAKGHMIFSIGHKHRASTFCNHHRMFPTLPLRQWITFDTADVTHIGKWVQAHQRP